VITNRQSRAIIRQAIKRVPEGEEIRHINIMPMMDIMTILLVAFLVIAVESSAALEVNNVDLPSAQSYEPQPELSEFVTITEAAILVDGTPFMEVNDGDVDASKKASALDLVIPELSAYLGHVRAEREQTLLKAGKLPDALPELVIFADRKIPFKLLYEVIASSRTDEAGYRRFRLMVLEASEAN
jgi:biopolymer transport protein ExbD